jgi:hypothetical protein
MPVVSASFLGFELGCAHILERQRQKAARDRLMQIFEESGSIGLAKIPQDKPFGFNLFHRRLSLG